MFFVDLFTLKNLKMTYEEVQEKLKSVLKSPQNSQEGMLTLEPHYYGKMIAKCGKDAYIDVLQRIEPLKANLKLMGIDSKKIATSKSAFGMLYTNIVFLHTPFPGTIFWSRLRRLLESNIPQWWESWRFLIAMYNDTAMAARNSIDAPKAVSVEDSNALVMFQLHIYLLCFATLVFLCEAWKKLYNGSKKIFKCLCDYARKFKHLLVDCFFFVLKVVKGFGDFTKVIENMVTSYARKRFRKAMGARGFRTTSNN